MACCVWATLLALSGCHTGPEEKFTKVEQLVTERVGTTPQWVTASAPPSHVQQRIDVLLRTNLTAAAAVEIALLNNPGVQAEFENIGIAYAELIQAGLLSNPRFAASWRFPEGGPGGINSEYSLAGNLLEIFMLPLRKRAATRGLAVTELQVADAVLKLAAEVKAGFYNVQAGEHLAERLRTIIEVNEASTDVARRRHEAGNISDLELAEQTAVYAASRVMLTQAQKQLRRDREALNRLLGLWGANTRWTVIPELPALPENEDSLDDLERLAVQQRLDLAATRAQLTNVAAALSLQQKTRFTPAGIEVGVSTEREPEGGRVTGPTLQLELPIFDQGQGSIAKIRAQFRQAELQLKSLAVNVRSEVREARDTLISDRDVAEYYGKVLLPLRQQVVAQALLQYNAMQIGPADLLRARERELEAERNFVEALRDYWISRAELERAIGGKFGEPVIRSQTIQTKSVDTHEGHNH